MHLSIPLTPAPPGVTIHRGGSLVPSRQEGTGTDFSVNELVELMNGFRNVISFCTVLRSQLCGAR